MASAAVEITMGEARLTFRDAPGLFPGSRVYRIACRHGVSSAALVPGKKPISDLTVFDLVLPGHHRRHGCGCLPGAIEGSVLAPHLAEGVIQ